jgi:hypothetical protein
MPSVLLTILLASAPLLAINAGSTTTQQEAGTTERQAFDTPRALLTALSQQDESTTTLQGGVRYTIINALENDMQIRYGNLAIRNDDNTTNDANAPQSRKYAVRFSGLQVDDRFDQIDEHYIFDGRWFVERNPEEKQFNKRELVPQGETLDPMELMRDAPFWVSLGRDQDRLFENYDITLNEPTDGLTDNADFPELASLAKQPHVQGTTQLMLVPKPGSGFEDDWEFVRIWVNAQTLLPALYLKQDWTGDIQVVELFETKRNEDIPLSVFDTSTPAATSGWNVQISRWRGDAQQRQPQDP